MSFWRDSRLARYILDVPYTPVAPGTCFLSYCIYTQHFLSETMSWGIMCAVPHASKHLRCAHFYFKQSQGPGWRGHPVEDSKFKPKKEKNQLQKLLGSGNINSEVFFQNTSKGRLRSFGRNSKGHSLFTQLSISRFN